MARLAPYALFQEMDNNGNPLAGGKFYTYEAGTTTPKASYTDSTGTVANANPVILDSAGRANVWLGNGAYKFVLKTSADVTIKTVDNLAGDTNNTFISQVVTTSSNIAITSVYRGAFINATATLTASLDSAATLLENFYFNIINNGIGTVTIDPYGSETINGQSTLTLAAGQAAIVVCDGSNWFAIANANGFTTGDMKPTYKTTADYGWIMMDEGTIGSAASGATGRANADVIGLYTLLWNNISNTWCAVSSGRGASAAADFAANKTLALPKILGRALAIAGTGFPGLTTRALGEIVGTETHTLTTTEMPVHSHGVTDPGHTHAPSAGNFASINTGATSLAIPGAQSYTATSATASATTGISINNAGSGGAHNNMQPSSFINLMIKL